MTTMRRLSWTWLLPLLLLLGQYGQFRHELDHYTKSASKSQKEQPADKERCPLCLAYGHLSGAAKTEPVATHLLTGLGFHHVTRGVFISVDPALPAARSRGPPTA